MVFQGDIKLLIEGSENLCSKQCQFYFESSESCILFNIELDYEYVDEETMIPLRVGNCKDIFNKEGVKCFA